MKFGELAPRHGFEALEASDVAAAVSEQELATVLPVKIVFRLEFE